VQDGWHRPARGRMALGGEPPRLHEDYGIVTLEPMVEEEYLVEALAEAIDFMEHHHDLRILTSCLSPLGLGLLKFGTATKRETAIRVSPMNIGPLHRIRVIPHDAGLNRRQCNYT